MALVRTNGSLDRSYPSPFSSIFEKFFNENFSEPKSSPAFIPAVDIAETADMFELNMAVPGMKKQDFSIDLADDKLIIKGERKLQKEESGKNFHTIQTQYGSFNRTFYLPENINKEKIEASYEDGILKVLVPKLEKKETKTQVRIK
jgi:HSP20 family protein